MCGRRKLRGVWASAVGAAAAAALAVPVVTAVGGPAGGRIHGRVIDQTAPHHAVGGQRVRLSIVERGASSEQDATTNPSGAFEFTGLPTGGIRVFLLSTEYRGVVYASDRIVLTDTAPERAADLAVYDTSPDRSAVRGSVALAVIDVARGAVRVSIVQDLQNPTDRTVVASADDPIVFPLPREAERVSMLAGWRDPHLAGESITEAAPLPPGSTRFAYAYELETRRSQLALPWSFPFGASEVEVLVPAGAGVTVAAQGLASQGEVAAPHGRYARWGGASIRPGAEVVMRVRGLPRADDPWPSAVAAGLGLVLFGGLAVALRRERRHAG